MASSQSSPKGLSEGSWLDAFRLSINSASSERSTQNTDDGDDGAAAIEGEIIPVLSSPATSSACRGPLAPQPVDWARLKQWPSLHALLGQSCDVRARDALGRTALHYAAGYGEREAASALVRHDAEVDAADRFGATPLHWACLKAHAPLVDLRARAGVLKGKTQL